MVQQKLIWRINKNFEFEQYMHQQTMQWNFLKKKNKKSERPLCTEKIYADFISNAMQELNATKQCDAIQGLVFCKDV